MCRGCRRVAPVALVWAVAALVMSPWQAPRHARWYCTPKDYACHVGVTVCLQVVLVCVSCMIVARRGHPRLPDGADAAAQANETAQADEAVVGGDAHAFQCPISFEHVAGTCTVTAAGHAYAPEALATWLTHGRQVDPMTNVELDASQVCTVRFRTRSDLDTAAARFRLVACAMDPLLAARLLRPQERVDACLLALGAHRASVEFLAYCVRARRLLLARRRPSIAAAVADRRAVLCGLGVDPRLFPDEHPWIGVPVDLTHVRRTHARVSFAGARVRGTARCRVFVDCGWVGAEFEGVRFVGCRFVGPRTTFAGATVVAGCAPVHVQGCVFTPQAGAPTLTSAVAGLRARGLPMSQAQ
jgi:hypothetical protein